MKNVRLAHFYLGVFFAPLIIFFAFTGVLQVFKLHESYREVPGSQGDWIAWFAQFHKEQAWTPPRVAPAKAATPGAASPPTKEEPGFKPMKFEFAKKDARMELRLPPDQLIALKAAAQKMGIPYTRLVRQFIAEGLMKKSA